MRYSTLGSSQLRVSRIALGGMSFGTPGTRSPWTLDERTAAPVFRRAVELGITLWDTANVYGNGSSEELVGRAIHRFDPATPVEETIDALQEVVTAGKARHIGASSMAAWQFAKMQHAADLSGGTRFVSMQDQYSLVQREEEREMFALLTDQDVSSLPWCPLAKGRLTRPFGLQTDRSLADPMGRQFFDGRDRPIIEAVERVAEARGVSMAQVALAWVLVQPVVAAPVVGATKPGHLDDTAVALDLTLTGEELTELAAPYTPREPTGY